MTSPGFIRQPAATHARPASPRHADCRHPGGQRGSPGMSRSDRAAWPGTRAARWARIAGPAALALCAAAGSAGQPDAILPRKTLQASTRAAIRTGSSDTAAAGPAVARQAPAGRIVISGTARRS